MKMFISALLISFTVFSFRIEKPGISSKELQPAIGQWKGTLTYLDYQSGKPYTMPAKILVTNEKEGSNSFTLFFEYPDEPKANAKDTLTISKKGTVIDGCRVVEKKQADGNLVLITEKKGKDDDRKAVLRYTYTIGPSVFIIHKDVKFTGEEKWIMRNEFKMSR